jgi:hypothetical protein
MSPVKKTALALSVLLSLEFLFLGLFTNGTFSWTNQYVPPLLKAALHADASAVKLDSPAKTNGGFVLERYGELTPRSGGFLAAKENVGISFRSFVVSPLFRILWLPKYLPISNLFSFLIFHSSEASFHSSDEKSSAVVVLDYFSLRRLFS